jgi:D-alanine-D-alanine ligase
MKIDKYIEIVASSNPRLNSMSVSSQLTVLATLRKHYAKVSLTIVDDMSDLEGLVAKRPDLVVLGMKLILLDSSMDYDDSPKVWLSDYLKENDVCFTGSDTNALSIEFDKPIAKQRVLDAGLQSSQYFISRTKQPSFKHSLRFPLFVKPTNRGDSKGIDEKSVVHSQRELEAKILSIHADCGSDALVEEYLSGREFSVAVIRQPYTNKLLAMPIEIIAPTDNNGNIFLSEVVKNADSEKAVAVTDLRLVKAINALAIGVFEALDARDYGRIDIRLDGNGIPSFIEANLMPGLSNHGYLSRCFFLNEGINYENMILSIVDLGIKRFKDTRVQLAHSQLRLRANQLSPQLTSPIL